MKQENNIKQIKRNKEINQNTYKNKGRVESKAELLHTLIKNARGGTFSGQVRGKFAVLTLISFENLTHDVPKSLTNLGSV